MPVFKMLPEDAKIFEEKYPGAMEFIEGAVERYDAFRAIRGATVMVRQRMGHPACSGKWFKGMVCKELSGVDSDDVDMQGILKEDDGEKI